VLLLTRLELYLRSHADDLPASEVAASAGYTRQHFHRLRIGESDATRGGILSVTGVIRKRTRERVRPGVLFERADAFLNGPGSRLSQAHRQDRETLDALLADDGRLAALRDHVAATGIASETAVRHLLKAGRGRLDTNPAGAAAIYGAAVDMARRLRDTPRQLAASLHGHALKGSANAWRMLGAFEDALSSLSAASKLFVDARLCTDEAGQVEYTRATLLFEMELWDDALAATRSAKRRFYQTGDTRRHANAELLEANILFEQGNSDAAHAMWLQVSNVLTELHSREGLARVWINLGVCEIQRQRAEEARSWLNRASAAFRTLNNVAELARTRWNMGTLIATFESPARALRVFRNAFRMFERLGILLDAGCVALDMMEVMIDVRRPDAELTAHARLTADTLARATISERALTAALDQLRQIARHRDKRRVVRVVRTALRDAKANCSEVSAVAALGRAG
jgi:tetratricopeptide (TPR) repeat protein